MINRSTVSTLRRSWPMVVLVVLGLIALIAYGVLTDRIANRAGFARHQALRALSQC